VKLYQNTKKKGDSMDLSERLTLLKSAKKSQETLDDLKALLSMSKQDKNSILAMDTIITIVELERYLRHHDESVKFLEEELNLEFFTSQEDRLKLIEEMIKTLLRTEDFIKLESILHNRERYLTNEHQKVMQKFYYAVCYEGLKEYKKAIDVLKSIKDTISSTNLVSKYLKLSMLYLKENNLQLARENFLHAEKFDIRRNNPIFCLAESDILYIEGDYLGALGKYQEYFIKSKNKHRYLDRFILINIKLNRLDEAWKFYQEYLPTMSSIISKNYRLVFYESALELATLLKNRSEIEKLNFLIDELEPTAPLLDRFDSVYRLLSVAFQMAKPSKPRDIILNIFRAVNDLYQFQKLVYIVPEEENIRTYHLQKNLLLEKSLPKVSLKDSLIENLLKSKIVNELYGYNDLIGYSHQIYKTVETVFVFASGIERKHEYGYFLAYSKERDNFDFQQKLVLLAGEILKKQLNDFDIGTVSDEFNQNIISLITISENGLIKIEDNVIHFLNNVAKKLLGIDSDYLAFEEFQTYLDKDIYIDDFLYTDKMILRLKNSGKTVEFSISKSEFVLFALVSESSAISVNKDRNIYYTIEDEKQLLIDNRDIDNKSIIIFEIRNYLDSFKDRGHEQYDQKLNDFFDFTKTTSRNHFDKQYLESYNIAYLTLKTIDKRVINRIVDSVIETFVDFDIRVAGIHINHTLTNEKLIQLRYLLSLTSEDNRVVFDNRNFRYNQELAKTIQINVSSLIQKKEVPLSCQSICDWSTGTPAFWLVKVSQLAMLGESDNLKRVLRATDLEGDFDNLIINTLAKDIKKAGLNEKFLIEVDWKTIGDKKQTSKLIRKAVEANIGFIVDLSEDFDRHDFDDFKDAVQLKELILVGKDFTDRINIKDLNILKDFDYLILNTDDLTKPPLPDFLKLLESRMILNHGHKTLRKSDLETFGVTYVFGDAFPKYESVTALKK